MGKNHLASAILRETGGLMYTAFEISTRLRQCYAGAGQEWEVLGELCETPVLAVNELVRTKGEAFDLHWLFHVIDKRHENSRPLILISNSHLQEDCPGGGCGGCLENFLDNGILSRVIEDGVVMKFAAADYRRRKRARSVVKEGAQ